MGRPATPLLSRDIIGQAALGMIDKEGPDAFSVNRLAANLGVHPSSLYNHVTSKADIIEVVRHLIVEHIDYSAFDTEPWLEALSTWARSYRAAFASYPNTIKLLATSPIRDEAALIMYEHVLDCLVAAGWPAESVMSIVTALESFIVGSVIDLSAPEQMVLADQSTGAPHLAATLTSSHTQAARRRADDDFELGLRIFLVGLERQHHDIVGGQRLGDG